MSIAGVSFIVLLAATILIWRSQRVQNLPGNTNPAATPQPSVATPPDPVKPIQIAELKPAPTPEFSEPTLWKRADTETTVQIVRNGNIVSALMNDPSERARAAGRSEGDLAFKGSYEGRTIKGSAYLLFSDEDVSRCPEFRGEQKADLVLTLSADGNTLSGSREEFNLSDECTIIIRPRKKLKYTRIVQGKN
jgi:hypothetical protein